MLSTVDSPQPVVEELANLVGSTAQVSTLRTIIDKYQDVTDTDTSLLVGKGAMACFETKHHYHHRRDCH